MKKTLAPSATTTTTNTVSAPESSAPVAKRLKAQSVVDKGLSSASHASSKAKAKAKRKRRRRFKSNSRRPSAIRLMRWSRRRVALHLCKGFDLSSVSLYHIGARLKKRQVTSVGIPYPWIGVSGRSSICMVVKSQDMLRLQQHLGMNSPCFFIAFWDTLISQVEGLSDDLLDQILKRKRPYGVVSVIEPDNDNKLHEASVGEYDVEKAISFKKKKAIKFIREEMESGAVFTSTKTTQTAISAFQHLFGKEFEDHEIRVFVFEYNGANMGKELKQSRKVPDMGEFLAIINKVRDRKVRDMGEFLAIINKVRH